MENTKIGLKFDDMVIITESFYPPASIPNFLAEIGGILGLWLGVVILQMFLYFLEFLDFTKVFVK